MNQFAYARSTDPASAHIAATSINSSSASRLCSIVLKCLEDFGPLTTHEIANKTGLTVVTVSPRIKPLREAGLVVDTGERRQKRSVWGVA